MYALIHREEYPNTSKKRVISIHASRKDSERALRKRQQALGKDQWACKTKIVWTDKAIQPGDIITENERLVWR